MPEGPCTVLGGLPVIAEVWFSGPDYQGEYDCGVNALYWAKSNGKRGKELSQALMNRIEKHDQYWQANVTEKVSDYLAYSGEDDSDD